MSGFAEVDAHDALGLAHLVATGEVTPTELLEEVLARIDRINPMLNAVVHRDDDRAHCSALDPAGGPFRGVPILIKDLAVEEGVPVTFGSVFLRDFVAPESSEMVRRMLIVDPDESVRDLMRGMRRQRRHMALVRTSDGVVLGMVTLEDVLEALVGDIRDETDTDTVVHEL